jgi:membrane associated rhomboid family serine protease
MYNSLVAAGGKDINSELIVVPFLQLIPNHTLFNPWTVISAIFVDATIGRFIVSLVLMYFAGRFVERSWSSKELIKFVCLIGGISNLVTSISIIFFNLIVGNDYFNIPVDGNLCLLVSFLVILKQLIPEHSIVLLKGSVQARVKHIPFVILLILTIISFVRLSPTPAVQAWIGLIVSWTYLRFFQASVIDPLLPQPNDVVGVTKLYGDASETFSFVHFFPDVLAPVLSPLFDQIFEIIVQLNLLNRFDDSEVEQGNLIASRRLTGQGSQQLDSRNASERRRQVALKVLEERIGEDAKKVPVVQATETSEAV